MRQPWNNWFHCCGSTYGTWLRGDPRGWRSRHHREHVDGDYKRPPPPGTYELELKQSERLMKRDRVVLSSSQRTVICRAFAQKLQALGVEFVDLCVAARHWHALLRCIHHTETLPIGQHIQLVRRLVGQAKGYSARHLSVTGMAPEGGVWAKRCRPVPIRNRQHQLNVAQYIRAHAKQGAAVYFLLNRREHE